MTYNLDSLTGNIIFVTGGVASGIGKGVLAASLGKLLIDSGITNLNMVKLDPYLNVDPGTLNPNQHGEVYVTRDGGEVDLDLGHYERFTGLKLSKQSSITAGSVYSRVIKSERAGELDGRTCQVIPHITKNIVERILQATKDKFITIVEVGGTVGDMEGAPFLEAVRHIKSRFSSKVLNLHLVWVPRLTTSGEFKTKPAQHSVQRLTSYGILPEFLFCRSDIDLDQGSIDKLKEMCLIDNVVSCRDLKKEESTYALPNFLYRQGVLSKLYECLGMQPQPIRKDLWVEKIIAPKEKTIRIGVVGKYDLDDAYISIYESLRHAALHLGYKIQIERVTNPDEDLDAHPWSILDKLNAVIIPGGFGVRGIEKKIKAAQYCLESRMPTLGICMGCQAMAVAWARSKGLVDAHTTEVDPNTPHPIVDLIYGKEHGVSGGTLRLGSHKISLLRDSLVGRLYTKYGSKRVKIEGNTSFYELYERFRHRYFINLDYHKLFEGSERDHLVSVGWTDLYRDTILEFKNPNTMYVGVQFHPEFESTIEEPHPLFIGLLKSGAKND